MSGTLGHVGRLIAVNHHLLLAAGYSGRTRDYDPMFAAMVVHLQAQPVTWLDFDPLNFISPPFF